MAGMGALGAAVGGNVAVGEGEGLGVNVGVAVDVGGIITSVGLGSAAAVRATAVGKYPSGNGVGGGVPARLHPVRKKRAAIRGIIFFIKYET